MFNAMLMVLLGAATAQNSTPHSLQVKKYGQRSFPGLRTVVSCDSSMILATLDEVLLSTNNGGQWRELIAPLPQKAVVDVLPLGDSIFVLTSNGAVHKTTNDGLTWKQSKRYKPGQTNRLFHGQLGVSAFEAPSANTVDSTNHAHYTARDSTLDIRFDNGMRMSITNTAIREVTCIAASDSIVYVGRAKLPILAIRLTDSKITELEMGHLNREHIGVLTIHDGYIYAGVMLGQGGLHRMNVGGSPWELVNIDRNTATVDVQRIVSGERGLYIGFREHGVAWIPNGASVAFPIHEGLSGALIESVDAFRGDLIVTARLRGLVRVGNCGRTVDRFSSSLPCSGEYVTGVSDSAVIVGLHEGVVIRSIDEGQRWDTLLLRFGESAINRIRSYGSTVHICTVDGVWSSADNGATWSRTFSQLPHQSVQDVHKTLSGWIVRTNQAAFICDTNGAYTTFAAKLSLPKTPHLLDVQTHGTMIYAVGFPGVFSSPDGGATWKHFTIADNAIVQTMSVINGLVYFSGVRGDIYYTNIQELD